MVGLLSERTWRGLRGTCMAHGLRFNTNFTRQEGAEHLKKALLDSGRLKRALYSLPAAERAPLVALQAAGGVLPLHRFVRRFGEIRPYRPWRDDSPRYPWKRPVSVAEKLWHLGFIEIVAGRPDQVMLAWEVLLMLPPLPRPRLYVEGRGQRVTGDDLHAALAFDLGALLGTLLGDDVRPLHGRWLPPWALRRWNERISIKEDTSSIRSELRTERLRFLHYLAEVNGFVALQGGLLKPTMRAWEWLANPTPMMLLDAIRTDINRKDSLWSRYRLPLVAAGLWGAVLKALSACTPGQPHSLASLYRALDPHLDGGELAAVPELLRTVLVWAGMVVVQVESFIPYPMHTYRVGQPRRGQLHLQRRPPKDHLIDIHLPERPDLKALAEITGWAQVTYRKVRVDAASVRRAVENGWTSQGIIRALACLCGPVSRPAADLLREWCTEAQHISLRRYDVLTVTDPVAMRRIRADWRLRPLLGEMLSARHVIVKSPDATSLCRKLARRGLPVARYPEPPPEPNGSAASITPEMAEYLYLAGRVYQQIGGIVALDMPVPGSALRWLAGHMPAGNTDRIEQVAADVVNRIEQTITGRMTAAGGVEQHNPERIREQVEEALNTGGSITIAYFSPAHGRETVRTIEPVAMYDRRGAEYVEAWCQLDTAARTFRLDRILHVLDTDAPT